MTPDGALDPALERAYAYWPGLGVAGCTAAATGLMGAAGLALILMACEQLRAGKLPLGIALVIIGLFTVPMLLLALFSLGLGILHIVRPPLLRVTPSALLLPKAARGEPPRDEGGDAKPDSRRPQPEAIPFSAIRWARRERKANPGSDQLVVVHDLASTTLVIEQFMMRREDFDELEVVLRTALPTAFASAPPTGCSAELAGPSNGNARD